MAEPLETSDRAATVAAALADARRRLAEVSETPRLDADVLLAHCCGIGRTAALTHPERTLDSAALAAFDTAIERRLAGEPVAYITGIREFYSLPLRVTPAVLVPRPETELVVDIAADIAGDRACRIVDLGTGSGAIALALKRTCPAADIVAVDIDADALAIARTNARDNDLDVAFVESSWFDRLPGAAFDLIVANPPYVRSDDPHFEGPLGREPRLALDGGADGLDCYRRILEAARERLAPGGSIVLEHGHDQREPLATLAASLGFAVVIAADDLGGRPRVLVLERSGVR